MQFIEFTDTHVRVYHTRIEHQGTPRFECGGMVSLVSCAVLLDEEGEPTGYLLVPCPTCDVTGCVPLTGGTDAQRLHAHVRLADPNHKAQTLPDAIASVLEDVGKRGGLPSLELAAEALREVKGAKRARIIRLSRPR